MQQESLTDLLNYQRLIANTISGVYNTSNNSKTVEKLRDELTGRIANSMERVFEDLKFTSLGDPLSNGSFYFTKGVTENFHYHNLSAGEKSAFGDFAKLIAPKRVVFCEGTARGRRLPEDRRMDQGSGELLPAEIRRFRRTDPGRMERRRQGRDAALSGDRKALCGQRRAPRHVKKGNNNKEYRGERKCIRF